MSFWNKFLSFFKKEEEIERRHCKGSCKHSLHIGINNYPGTANDLRGCVNDANNWEDLLREQYGFSTAKLLDNKATYKNVVKEIKKLVELAEKDSHVCVTFSGHGTSVKDQGEKDEQDGRDEALCLYSGGPNGGLLIDDTLRELLNDLDKDAKLTFISDSCHSGTVTRSFLSAIDSENSPKPRYLPPMDEEAFEIMPKAVSRKLMHPKEDMNHILLSGSAPHEYSYDVFVRNENSHQGMMSNTAINILKKNPGITYRELHKKIRKSLPSRQTPQSPSLEGKSSLLDQKVFS